jgi:DNA-binding beta-propeller fold protein YncE
VGNGPVPPLVEKDGNKDVVCVHTYESKTLLSATDNATAKETQPVAQPVTRVLRGSGKMIAHQSYNKGIGGLAINQEGHLLASVKSDMTVKVFSCEISTGKYIKTLCAGRLSNPEGIALDDDDSLYVADCMQEGMIRVFDKEGIHVRNIGKGILSYPCTVAVHKHNVYVCNGNGVCVFDKQGQLLMDIGKSGSNEPGQVLLSNPQGVAVDGNGKIYVSHSGRFAGIISVFDSHGAFIRNIGHYNPFSPKGLTVDRVGRIYVVSGEVVVMDTAGTFIRTIFISSDGKHSFGGQVGHACVDDKGHVCVTQCVEKSLGDDGIWYIHVC